MENKADQKNKAGNKIDDKTDRKVLNLESSVRIPIEKSDSVLRVRLGWDARRGSVKEKAAGVLEEMIFGQSEKSYDLNLAAIVKYRGDRKPELVFHSENHSCDSTGGVGLGRDNRTGIGARSDETIHINLGKMPEDVEKIILFMNIAGANALHQSLSDVENIFVQIEDEFDDSVYLREENAFKNDAAKEFCCYTFAELLQGETRWILRGLSRYSREDRERDTFEALVGSD